jgi:hypothetical protein
VLNHLHSDSEDVIMRSARVPVGTAQVMMKTNRARKKAWGKMSAAELAEATKEFDRPLPASRYKPVTRAERARFERALRAGGSGKQRAATGH